MRVVVDALPVHGENSLSIVVEHLLRGWAQIDSGDEVHVAVRPGARLPVPASFAVHEMPVARLRVLGRVACQTVAVPRLCRRLGADVLLGVLPATSMVPLPCPRVIVVYDLRYRLHPEEFSKKALLLRRVSYGIGFAQADGIACISERTKRDVLEGGSRLGTDRVQSALLGADHVLGWPAPRRQAPYAIAFGHFVNKNADLVMDAWAAMKQRGDVMELRLLGLPPAELHRARHKIAVLGLEGTVTAMAWMPTEEFERQFASADLVVFPSHFEGFGLPVVEAMRLGIPVVITPEPALLEVAGGHATVAEEWTAQSLAEAVGRARRLAPERLAAARRHAAQFTWSRCAEQVRQLLVEVAGAPSPARTR